MSRPDNKPLTAKGLGGPLGGPLEACTVVQESQDYPTQAKLSLMHPPLTLPSLLSTETATESAFMQHPVICIKRGTQLGLQTHTSPDTAAKYSPAGTGLR